MGWRAWGCGGRLQISVILAFVAAVVGGAPAAAAAPVGVAFRAQAQGRFSTVGQLGEAITARMREVGSARVTQTGQVTLPFLDVEISGDGAVRYVPEFEFELTTRFEGSTLPSTETHVIVDQGMFYYKVGGFEPEPGRPWVRQPIEAAGGQPASLVFDAEGFLDQVVTDRAVELVGQELVDGEPTEGYRTTLDLSETAGLVLDLPAQGLLPAAPATVTYFLDGENTVRKVVLDLPDLVTMAFTLSDFGAPLEITAPPPDQVTSSS